MLVTTPDATASNANQQFDNDEIISLKDVLSIVSRHKQIIFISLVAGLVLGLIYIFFAQPRYTATTSILIDPRQQSVLPDLLGNDYALKDRTVIDSQIEVIRSTKLLEKVAQRSGMFNSIKPSEPSFLVRIKHSLFGEKPDSEKQAKEISRTKQARLQAIRGSLGVSRMQGTYVIKISYSSGAAEHAAFMANLIADTYLEDELEAQYEASERTNAWLKSRLSVLREELTRAERAVETYKEENDLIHASGQTISEQFLAELNASLSAARTESTQAKAKYDRMLQIIETGDPSIATSNLVDNRVVSSLHDKYIELSRLATEIKRKQGEEHLAYQNLRRQMEDIQKIILTEYERIADSYKTQYELANKRVNGLQEEMESAIDGTSQARRSAIELRELERRAESTRNLYTKMLDNFNEQTEKQSVPVVNARIISNAMTPFKPSWPNTRYILLLSLIAGAIIGMGLAFLREQFNRFIWKPEELESLIHRTCLGMLPKVAFDGAKFGKLKREERPNSNHEGFNVDGFAEVTQLLNKQTGVTTEIMRNIQLAVQFQRNENQPKHQGRVISFVSARPGEGKSITSCFLAKHLAKSGARVALIDCDFRRPSLTHWFFPNAPKGMYEIASRLDQDFDPVELDREIDEITYSTGEDPLFFIPAKTSRASITNLNLLSSGQMHQLIQHLQTRFDAILIDLPPIINIVDARVIASSIDCFVFLAHWGKTDRELVRKALHRAPEVYNKTAGALLTLVDTEKAGSYGYYNYNYYYQR